MGYAIMEQNNRELDMKETNNDIKKIIKWAEAMKKRGGT